MKCERCGNDSDFTLMTPMVIHYPIESYHAGTLRVNFDDGDEFPDTDRDQMISCNNCGDEWPVGFDDKVIKA